MINERAIINFLIVGATLLLLPFLVTSTLTIDYLPVLLIGGISVVIWSFFYLKERLCMCPLLGLSTVGTANFLPVPLKAVHFAFILLILFYITGYVAIRQKSFKFGKVSLLGPILVVAAIVFHNNPSVGLHVFGGSTEGGRPVVLIYLAVIGYFCGINIKSPSVAFMKAIPWLCVVLMVLTSIPFILSTFFPALAPYLYAITDTVNVEAYKDYKAPTVDEEAAEGIGRLSVYGGIGSILQLYLLSFYPIGTWLRPNRWWVAALSLLCMVAVIVSGYRSLLVGYYVMFLVATWCYYSWRSVFLPFFVTLAAVVLAIALTNRVIDLPLAKLPLIAQRTLSFMPGDWSQEALDSAKSSNDFRKNIQDVYLREYFWNSPLFGNGFDIDTAEYSRLNDAMMSPTQMDPDYMQAKLFITGKLFHTGWLSVYDCVGIVGSTAFIFLGLAEIWMAGRLIFGRNSKRSSPLFPLYVWMMATVVTTMFTFFSVYGDFSGTFSQLCIYGIALSQIYDMEATGKVAAEVPVPKTPASFPALKGAVAPYHAKNLG